MPSPSYVQTLVPIGRLTCDAANLGPVTTSWIRTRFRPTVYRPCCKLISYRGVKQTRMSSPPFPPLPTLPKPEVSSGFGFSKEQLTTIVPVAVAAVVGTYLVSRCFSGGHHGSKGQVNLTLNKDSPKVVHSFDIEDIGSKAVYCRCWRSKKFPYCDGSHAKHNEVTGDNVGPLIIKRKDA